MEPTLDEMITEIRRELALRRAVYPRQIELGRLSQQKADRQVAVMEAALARIEGLRDDEQGEWRLTG